MKNRIIQIFLLGLLSACSGNKDSVETIPLNCDVYKITIPLDEAYYDSVTSHIADTSFVVLNEGNNIMFSCADKIIEYNNKYYILDQSALRTVVSFKRWYSNISPIVVSYQKKRVCQIEDTPSFYLLGRIIYNPASS